MQNPTENQKRELIYMAPAAAARVFEVSRATVWRWIAQGHVHSIRIGPRVLRVGVPAELLRQPEAAA